MIYIKRFENINLDDWDYNETPIINDDNFIKFLKDYNILDKFIDNIGDKKMSFDENLYISSAFDWDSTEGGVPFWSHINDMWLKRLDDLHTRTIKHRGYTDFYPYVGGI